MFEDNNLNNMKSYKIAQKADEDLEKEKSLITDDEQPAEDALTENAKKGKNKKDKPKKASIGVLIADVVLVIASGAASVFLFYEIAAKIVSKEFLIMLAITLFLCGTGIFDLYLNLKNNSKGKKKKKAGKGDSNTAYTMPAKAPAKAKPKKSGKSYGANKKRKKH